MQEHVESIVKVRNLAKNLAARASYPSKKERKSIGNVQPLEQHKNLEFVDFSLGCSWGALGLLLWCSWAALGVLLGALGVLLGPLGVLLGCSWAPLGASWGPLGVLLGASRGLLGGSKIDQKFDPKPKPKSKRILTAQEGSRPTFLDVSAIDKPYRNPDRPTQKNYLKGFPRD